MPRSIMKKSSFMTRRKIIIYIIATILILGIVSGFSDPFLPDNTVYKASVGETIVAEKVPPASGTPADHDLMSNLQFAAYKLHHSTYFRAETDGTVIADIGFTTYTQKLTNTRVVLNEDTVFAETISSSSLKSLAEQKYVDNGIIIYRPSTKVSNGKATFANTAYPMTYEEYANGYGTVPNQLSKYIIDPQTITAVRDDNATVKQQSDARRTVALADEAESDGIDYYIPENLVPDADGNYCFTLTLDPETSTRYYRNEVRTLGGADQNPKFHSAQVTVKIAPDWTPITVTTVENYDIAIPVLGAMNCTGTNIETFYDVNSQGDLPERDFFQPYIDNVKNDPDYVPPAPPAPTVTSPADYLAAAFADYISGAKPLELTVDITVGDISAYDLTLSADLQTLDIQAMLGDLYIGYFGDKVYINLNELNGYMSTSDFAEFAAHPKIAQLLGVFGDLSAFDVTSLFGGDMLGTIFADCEMTTTDGITRIHMPFSLDASTLGAGDISIDASLYIDDQSKALKSINGVITAFGKTITITAKPLKRSPRFPSTDGAVDISGVLDFIPDALETLSEQTLGICGRITTMGKDIDVTAYIDRTDGLKMDATLSALGLDIAVKYIDGTVYVSLGNIDARGTTDEFPALINSVLDLTGADLGKYADMIKPLLPSSVNDFIGMIKSLEATDDTLAIGLRALTVPVDITIKRADGMISALGLDIAVDMFGIKFDAAATLDVTAPEQRDISLPDGDFVTFAELATFINDVKPYIQSGACYDIALDGNIALDGKTYDASARLVIDTTENGIAATGAATVLNQTATLVYADGTAYVSLGNIKLKLDTADMQKLGSPAARILAAFVDGKTNTSDVVSKILGSIQSVSFDENGALTATVSVGGDVLAIALDAKAGKLDVTGNAMGAAISLGASIAPSETPHGITPPADADSYADIAVLEATLEKAADILEQRLMTATVIATYGETTLTLGLELDFGKDKTLKARITENSYGLCATLIGKTVYIALGDIRVAGSLDDLPDLFAALDGLIPAELGKTLTDLLSGTLDIDIAAAFASALDCVKSVYVDNGRLNVGLAIDGININIDTATDLTDVCVTVIGATENVRITLNDITPCATDISVSGEYVPAATLIAACKPLIPLARAQGFDVAVNVKLGNVDVVGNVYICLTDGAFVIDARLTAGDLPVRMTVDGGMLYISIGSDINVSQPLTEEDLTALLDKLDRAIPGLKAKVTAVIEQIKSMTLDKMLGCIALFPTADGFAATLDMRKAGMDAAVALTATVKDGTLGSLAVDCTAFGTEFAAQFDAVIADGVLASLIMREPQDGDALIRGVDISIAATDARTLDIDASKYVPLEKISDFISPILDLVNDANGVRSITLDVNAFLLTKDNAQTTIKGSIALSLDPIAVNASLRLFAGTTAETELNIVFANGTLYVQTGNIMLSFDTANNLQRLYDVLSKYLPEYINDEIAKLFGLKSGTSAFSDVAQLIDRFNELSAAQGLKQQLDLIFAPLETVAGDSMLKTVADMLRVFERDGMLTIGLNVMGVTLNATPMLDANKTELVGLTADTSLAGFTLKFGVDGFALSDSPIRISAPQNAADYVSIVEFIETIDNAVTTFTTRDADGNITFEAETLDFDYQTFEIETTIDENGNTVNVKDEAGRDKPRVDEFGNKIVASTVRIYNKPGYSAIKGKFIKHEQTDESGNVISTSYKFNLEAHIVLDISTLGICNPVTIDLYVVNNSDTAGMAFIDYAEGTGHGERISIDYESILQIAAAALDIIGIDDGIVDMLLGDHRLDIDTSIFDSMDIAGLDTIKDTLTKLVGAVQYVKDGIAAAKDGWNSIATAGSIEELRKRLDDVKAKFGSAVELIKTAVSLFTAESTSSDALPPVSGEPTELNGELFKQIVNGVTLRKDDTHIWATIDNTITTGADGDAAVTVTQSDNKIDGINVSGLDVNTAKLQNFDISFTAGKPVEVALPDNYNCTVGNSTYSDFSNIKHLLFDVMNTANMFEFEIGDADAATNSNKIELGIKLLGVESIKIDIRYNVKVRIIDQGEGAEPRYKTAAIVELIFQNCKAAGATLVPNCTTKLYFYDNVIYVKGLEWYEEAYKNWLGQTKYEWKQRDVTVAYSVEQLGNMLSSDIGMEKLMYELLFYMLPLSRNFTIFGIDLQGKIAESVSAPSTGADPAPTVATVFKGYAYVGGTHSVKIGLSELAEAPDSNMLGDLTVTLTGKNDGDDNVLDNYISAASITTSLVNNSACTINVRLFAELRNPETYTDPADGIQKLRSKGLTDTTDGYMFDGIINNVIPSTDWQYIWA